MQLLMDTDSSGQRDDFALYNQRQALMLRGKGKGKGKGKGEGTGKDKHLLTGTTARLKAGGILLRSSSFTWLPAHQSPIQVKIPYHLTSLMASCQWSLVHMKHALAALAMLVQTGAKQPHLNTTYRQKSIAPSQLSMQTKSVPT